MDAGSRDQIAALEQRIEMLEAQVETLKPRSWVRPEGVITGGGVRVHPTCTIIASDGRTVRIGGRTRILRGAEIVGPVTIGAGCFINRDAYIRANVTIGRNCNIGPFVRLATDSHELGGASRRAGRNTFDPIIVGDGTWIGANVTVLGGVTIGEGCVVAAGAVVTRDVPANSMIGGVPAKVIKTLDGDAPVTAR